MEIAEIIALAFVAAGTLSYGTTRQWRNNHRNHLKDTTSSLEEDYLVSLTFDPPAGHDPLGNTPAVPADLQSAGNEYKDL